MGSPAGEVGRYDHEGPQHEVTLTQGFWLGDTACTQALWEAIMGKHRSRFKGAERPVENVRWGEMPTFLRKLNGLLSGLDLTLPTEAQWEYACRAGTTTAFSFGESINPEKVNFDGNFPYAGASKGLSRDETVVVRSLPSNAWGLYEMHGNVSEWCIDGQRDYSDAQEVDPWGPTDWTGRAVRGGNWASNASLVRCAFRGSGPNYRDGTLGFRCARAPQRPEAVALPEQDRETEPWPMTGPAWRAPAHTKKRRWWAKVHGSEK
jgi:formylglycine-generating enzyme required for sulfatase activity